jgi:hypothetical protein
MRIKGAIFKQFGEGKTSYWLRWGGTNSVSYHINFKLNYIQDS